MALLVDCPIGYAVRSETDGGVQAQGSFYRPSDSSHSRRWMESLSTRKLLHTIGFVASHRWMEDLCQSTFLQSIRFLDKPKWMESLCQLTSPQWPPQTSFSHPIQFETSSLLPTKRDPEHLRHQRHIRHGKHARCRSDRRLLVFVRYLCSGCQTHGKQAELHKGKVLPCALFCIAVAKIQ